MNKLSQEHLMVSALNNHNGLHNENFSYKSIFFTSIEPDKSNARFMPAILMDDGDAQLFVRRKITKKQLIEKYNVKNQVIIGKSCIINCFDNTTAEWKEINKSIESIIRLGNNISDSELIQAPTLYPIDNDKYQVLTGHRRFFALIYAKGYGSAAQFKLYDDIPLLAKIKQFQENTSREDLSQYGKLMAFSQAISEIEVLNTARLRTGLKKLTVKEVASHLGVSMGSFDNYNVLTRYSCIISAYKNGLSQSFIIIKKLVLAVESEYKIQNEKSVLNKTDRNNISDEIESRLFKKNKNVSSEKHFKIKKIKNPNTIKTLLTCNILALDTGIDWDNIDWEDHDTVSNTLSTIIEFLELKKSEN
jgi:hypothetical protein